MSTLGMRRPVTLSEVVAEAETYEDFGMNMRDFLHVYAERLKQGQPITPMLIEEPPLLEPRFAEGNICDAFVAATADFLSRKNKFHTPVWALNEARVLEKPWFAWPALEVRALLLRDTPSAFKDKNIFILENAFNVA
jgi:hypothetical protein